MNDPFEQERKNLTNYRPGIYNQDLKVKKKASKTVRIGLFGPSGSGKSAFINMAFSAFNNTSPMVRAKVRNDALHGTLSSEDYALTPFIKLCDIRGLEFIDLNTEKIHVLAQVDGALPQNTNLVKNTDLGYSWSNYLGLRVSTVIRKYEKCQVVLFVVNLVDFVSEETFKSMKNFVDTLKQKKMNPLVILTHMDKVSSERVKEMRVKFSQVLDIDRTHVIAITNYHLDEEADLLDSFERDFKLETRVLRMVSMALVLADDRLKFL